MFVIYLISVFYEGLSVASQTLNMYRGWQVRRTIRKVKNEIVKI